jgi:hypothetical protein
MTIEDIQDMTDEEWFGMSIQQQYEASQIIMDSFVTDGIAYKGEDGRYRMREGVECSFDGDDVTVFVPKPN